MAGCGDGSRTSRRECSRGSTVAAMARGSIQSLLIIVGGDRGGRGARPPSLAGAGGGTTPGDIAAATDGRGIDRSLRFGPAARLRSAATVRVGTQASEDRIDREQRSRMRGRPDDAGLRRALRPAPLVAAAALVVVLTWQAWSTARSHRATVDNALREYASFAAWQYARRASDHLRLVLWYTFQRID